MATEFLIVETSFRSSWGSQIWIGKLKEHEYEEQEIFVAIAPVGSGSGCLFSELYAAGAEYFVRCGSDDAKNPELYEYNCVKVVDETDNLYGFYNQASGVRQSEWGQSVFSSPIMLKAFEDEASIQNLPIETRICHHMENNHSLRNPGAYPKRKETI